MRFLFFFELIKTVMEMMILSRDILFGITDLFFFWVGEGGREEEGGREVETFRAIRWQFL